MNEYVIHAKVKNNLILARILARHGNVAEFCAEHGLNEKTVGELINMKRPAQTADGEWSRLAITLAEALGVEVEDLFAAEQRTIRLARNDVLIELSRQQALALRDPIEAVECREMVAKLLARAGLSARETSVLQWRFAEELTLDEVGERLDVVRERARHIEARALEKLRQAAEQDSLAFG